MLSEIAAAAAAPGINWPRGYNYAWPHPEVAGSCRCFVGLEPGQNAAVWAGSVGQSRSEVAEVRHAASLAVELQTRLS